jgi:hypothetical protein
VESQFISWNTNYQLATLKAKQILNIWNYKPPQISLVLPWQLCRAPQKSWGKQLSFLKSLANLQNENSHPETSATVSMSLRF